MSIGTRLVMLCLVSSVPI